MSEGLIGSESSLVKSQLKSGYVSRSKMWEFSVSFAVEGEQAHLLGV